MANKNIEIVKELNEVFKTLSKAFYEIETPMKNYFIQEAEIKILSMQANLLNEELNRLGA